MLYYRQCVLTRKPTTQVAFIPEEFAVVGKFLRIGEENGWRVKESSSSRMEASYLQERERDYLYQRRASDI